MLTQNFLQSGHSHFIITLAWRISHWWSPGVCPSCIILIQLFTSCSHSLLPVIQSVGLMMLNQLPNEVKTSVQNQCCFVSISLRASCSFPWQPVSYVGIFHLSSSSFHWAWRARTPLPQNSWDSGCLVIHRGLRHFLSWNNTFAKTSI